MPLWILNFIGWCVSHWRIVLYVVAAIALFVVFGLVYRSCSARKAKLDEAAIQKAQQSITRQDRKEMVEILAQSDLQEAQIDANVANAKAATINSLAESRKKYSEMDNADLAAELERRSR